VRPNSGFHQTGLSAFSCLCIRLSKLLLLAAIVPLSQAQGIYVTLRSNADPYPAYQSYAGVWGDGNYAYVGSERRNGVLIFDITNPDAPVLASYYGMNGPIDMEDIKVANGIGYFADNMGSGLHIVDVSDPYHPALLSQITSANGGYDNTHKVAIWQNFVFIPQNLTSPAIIKVFDVSNPSSPALKTSFTATDPKWVNDIDIQTNGTTGETLLYTAGWGGKCDIWDITSIATSNPILLGAFSAGADGSSASATADGNYLAYATKNPNGTSFVTIYNISNPASVTVASTLTMPALGIQAVTPHDPRIMGNLLYVSWFQAGTLIFDITNPAAPVFVGAYDTWPGPVNPGQLDGNWGVYPYLGQDRVLLSDRNTGLYVVDATGVSSQPALYNLELNPTTVLAGASSTGTVYLVGVAGAGGTVINTSSDNAAAVTPANVTIPANATSAPFTITTSAVTTTTTATISASYGGATDNAPLTITPVADFLLSAEPTSMTLYPNQSGTVSGTLTAVAGYSSVVTLSCMPSASAPSTCAFSPNPITPTTSGVAFTLTVASPTSATYNFNLQATGNDSKTTTHTVPLTVNVADFNLGAPSPATLTALPGQGTSFGFQVTATGAFNTSVDLTCNNPATGVSCGFSPSASVNPTSSMPVSVTTSVATSTATPVGQYTLVVSGNAVNAPAPKTQNVTLDIVDFSLGAPSPGSVSLLPGASAQVMAQVNGLGNFAGAVTLSCNAPAAGVSCSFSPSATVNPTSSAPVAVTITVATTTATPGGQYSVVIAATSPGAAAPKTQTLALAVMDFAITPATASQTVPPGQTASYPLTISGIGGPFTGVVALTCSGNPPLTTCSLAPSSVTPGSSGASSTLMVQTTAPAVAHRVMAILLYGVSLPLFGLVLLPVRKRRRTATILSLTVLFLLLILPACGGGGSSAPPPRPGTTPGTYTLTVTGISGTLSHSTNLTLTIQ